MLASKGSLRLPWRLTCCKGESLRMRLRLLLLLLMLLCDAILCGFSAWATLATWGCVNEGFCDWIAMCVGAGGALMMSLRMWSK